MRGEKIMKKKLLTFVLASVMALSAPVTASAYGVQYEDQYTNEEQGTGSIDTFLYGIGWGEKYVSPVFYPQGEGKINGWASVYGSNNRTTYLEKYVNGRWVTFDYSDRSGFGGTYPSAVGCPCRVVVCVYGLPENMWFYCKYDI